MKKILLTLLSVSFICSILSSCGIIAKANARNDMSESKTTYKNCLAQHPENTTPCNGAKLAYEADMKAYRATSAGILPGSNDSINFNSSSE